MSLIYIIEDEPIMADCIASAILGVTDEQVKVAVFNDGVSAMEAVNEQLPDVILLDIMLTGPDGFAFLNEMISYPDTAKIPVVLISSLDLTNRNLEHYGIKQILNKATMTPEDIYNAINAALASAAETAMATAVAAATPQSELETAHATPALPASVQESAAVDIPAVQPSHGPMNLEDFKQRLADSSQQEPHA